MMKLVLVAACALIDADNRVLIGKRAGDDDYANLWEFPGGKIEENETPEDAIIRELKEELGIDVNKLCLAPLTFASHSYESFHLLMPVYICRKWQGEISANAHQALKWVHVREMRNFKMPAADEPLIAHLFDVL